MDAETTRDHEALLAQLAGARAQLDGLVGELRGIDRELEDLAPERASIRSSSPL